MVGFNSLSALRRLPALPVRFDGPKLDVLPAATVWIRPAELALLTGPAVAPSLDIGLALIVPDLLLRPDEPARETLDVGE